MCIGVVRSAQQEKHWRHQAPNLDYEQFLVQTAKQRGVPLGRVGEAEEVGDMIAYLLSDRGAFISGTAINIDGGMSPLG